MNNDKTFWKNFMLGKTTPKSNKDFNFDEPTIFVNKSNFKDFEMTCNICGEGIVKILRDGKTLKLVPETRCLLCGQPYYIEDIKRRIQMKENKKQVLSIPNGMRNLFDSLVKEGKTPEEACRECYKIKELIDKKCKKKDEQNEQDKQDKQNVIDINKIFENDKVVVREEEPVYQ